MKKTQLLFLMLLLPLSIYAQRMVKGNVKDNNGLPLMGASVLVKNTTIGTVTDFDGNFTLELNSDSATLVVSFIGFKTEEIQIGNKETISVVLEVDSEALEEVVVIGYGTVLKKDLTGSISSINPDQKDADNARGVENFLQGRVSGVQVSSLGAEPGAPSSIKIRGTNSLTSATEPLYVIDGVIVNSATEDTYNPIQNGNGYLAPQGGITGVNPSDIENIQILKDASATAIYGSRGSNGVILITTKKGRSGKAKFTFTSNTSFANITNEIDVLNLSDYADYQNTKQANLGNQQSYYRYADGSIAVYQDSEQYMLDNSADIDRLRGVNWNDEIYKTGVSTNNRLTASGGSDTGNYYMAIGYNNAEGIIPNAYSRKGDFVVNLNKNFSKRVKLGTKISTTFVNNSSSKGTEGLGGANTNLVRQIISGIPYEGYNYTNDGYDGDIENAVDGPKGWIEDYDDLSEEIRALGSLKLDVKISKVFTYRFLAGADYRTKDRQVWYGLGIYRGEQANGEAGLSTLNRFRYNIDNTLMFRKKFNKNHRIDGTVGVIFDQTNITRTTNQSSNFANHDLRSDGISYGEVYQPLFLNKEEEAILSFIGRINYALMDRYLFTGTIRMDSSSKFAEEHRKGYFPSFAFAWKAKEETFLEDVEWLTDAKLRLGWGLTGNQGIPNYRTITPYGPTFTPVSDGSGGGLTSLIPTTLANPDLKWETTSQYNAGIDLGFLDNKIIASVDVYKKKISDLLLNVDIGPSVGFSSYYANQGNLRNEGIEFSIDADIIDKKVKWNVFGNMSFNKNEITNLGIPPAQFGNGTYSAFVGGQISGGNYFKVPANIFIDGRPSALFFGFETDGIINDDGELANSPSFRGVAPMLGDVRLVDQNDDGNIDDNDLTIIGDPNPSFTYGFGTSVSYEGLSLSLFFTGVHGNDIANGSSLRDAYADNTASNIRQTAYNNAWSPENTNGSYPRIGYDLQDETGFTDRIVEDGSFLRLGSAVLAYSIPTDGIKGIDNLGVSITGQNLFLITDYSGYDPEVNSFSYDPGRVGVDWNSFPNQRTFIIGLNMSF